MENDDYVMHHEKHPRPLKIINDEDSFEDERETSRILRIEYFIT